ncbi:MAG: sn-glycerol-3-phosphate ABC transporter ATP-binding protein UgpC [Acidimicrobiaceae bacterium]|nr:sn-glycerol-3-phosphate ABC transporter ATP-binding protein UgpC [Acidimicrobiaceae bacterium]MYE09016.1 sn-glycerol-3-phosphate ABC transporter ATP-binding protein UgpC [Acidimicrobiaceae bacterium]MYI35842.1 sn-glycerol-3-phosphate ABC transporter ATP-binding protein UgpC [Acidimicrobiaceae bacterium]
MADVVLEDVNKEYDNGFRAVTDLNLEINEAEFLVMVGPSGCGKSTTLRMIAGLEDITSGTLKIGERVVNELPPKDRDIAMVFQNYALYPHMSVFDNIAFSLKLARRPRSEIKERVSEVARILELESQLDKRPAQLSGGQRQRVAMGRAIVRRPRVFLLDEPLSNLDAKLRVQMRAEITGLQREVGITTFYVTHDQVEAMTMADRVAVISAGLLQQVDTPMTLFNEPDNIFVAAFIGSPSMNIMEGVLTRNGQGLQLALGDQSLAVPDDVLKRRPALEGYLNRDVAVGVRPKDLEDAAVVSDHPADQRLRASVLHTEALGFEIIAYFDVDAKPVISKEALELSDEEISAAETSSTRVHARFNPTTRVRSGDTIDVAVTVENAHFFDLDSGLAIRA